MGQVLHRSATTTEAVRRAIQHSQESLRSAGSASWDQPEDGRQVEEARLDGGSAYRTDGSQVDGSVRSSRKPSS